MDTKEYVRFVSHRSAPLMWGVFAAIWAFAFVMCVTTGTGGIFMLLLSVAGMVFFGWGSVFEWRHIQELRLKVKVGQLDGLIREFNAAEPHAKYRLGEEHLFLRGTDKYVRCEDITVLRVYFDRSRNKISLSVCVKDEKLPVTSPLLEWRRKDPDLELLIEKLQSRVPEIQVVRTTI